MLFIITYKKADWSSMRAETVAGHDIDKAAAIAIERCHDDEFVVAVRQQDAIDADEVL